MIVITVLLNIMHICVQGACVSVRVCEREHPNSRLWWDSEMNQAQLMCVYLPLAPRDNG